MKPDSTDQQAAGVSVPIHKSKWRRVPALLLILFTAQSLWFIETQSFTYDEPGDLIAGLQAWQQHRFEFWTEHTPLGTMWMTLPVVRSHVAITTQSFANGYRVTAMQPGPEWVAWHTRPMSTLLGIVLGVVLWFATRRLFSEGAANVALGLFAFTPSLIAHFSLTTTDGMGALFFFCTAFQLLRWRAHPTRGQTALLGVVLGGLLLSKLYAPPFVLLTLVLMLMLDSRGRLLAPWHWNWKPTVAVLGIALVTWWAGYLFHVSHVHVGDDQVVATFPNRPTKIWATKSKAHIDLFLPAGEFFEGLREVSFISRRGRPAWFLGQVYPKGGIRLYYPVAIGLKWPTILLLLFVVSLALGVRRTCRVPGGLLIMSLFGFVYLAFALQSRYAIGERHVLPMYPFVLLLAGGLWEHAKRHRWAVALVLLALCLNAADALRYAPGYLSYFNIFVKPVDSWRLLTDSNLDWGQGLLALRDFEHRHPHEVLHLAYFGSVDPSLYGVQAMPLPPGQLVDGEILAGATCLSGQTLEDPTGYHWLWHIPPRQVLDHAIWVFDVEQKSK